METLSNCKSFAIQHRLSMREMCEDILERHRDTIQIKRRHVAVANLEKIVSATLSIANRSGFGSMSIRDLRRETGFSLGALYAYFDSKETLLIMILSQVQVAVDRVFQPPAVATQDPVAHFKWLLKTHVYLTEALHTWMLFSFLEVRNFDRQARSRVFEAEQHTEELIAEALGRLPSHQGRARDELLVIAALIKSMLQDWYLKRWKHRRRRTSPDAFADMVFRLSVASLRDPAPATSP